MYNILLMLFTNWTYGIIISSYGSCMPYYSLIIYYYEGIASKLRLPFFFQKKTPSISYKILQMSYVQIPVGMR